MKNIKLMNKIAKVGTDVFDPAKYAVGADIECADAIMVRSAALHDMEFNPELRAISRCGAGVSDTLGTMTFTFAVGLNPILTAPITSSYCLVTIVLARIFLKERLTPKQYLSLAFLVIGIALLGVSEIFNA